MTTKSPPRKGATAPWTKQIISFGTSFAFFGLAGVLQSAFATEQLAQEQQAAQAAAQEALRVIADPVAPVEEPLLGPLQPKPEADLALTSTEEPEVVSTLVTPEEPEVVSTPAVVNTPAEPVEQVPVDGESGGS